MAALQKRISQIVTRPGNQALVHHLRPVHLHAHVAQLGHSSEQAAYVVPRAHATVHRRGDHDARLLLRVFNGYFDFVGHFSFLTMY